MGRKRGGNAESKLCWHCGGRGHDQSQCTAILSGDARHCFLCRSLDHMSTECPLRSNEPKQKDPPWVKELRQVGQVENASSRLSVVPLARFGVDQRDPKIKDPHFKLAGC
ncbi:unnamed protein product, partial [Effrenium voratum]